ncbi:hypothetical protein [Allopontixanthobacter sp.]|uniref:hypothetical protein n=1 Tax=Allopontixanthobacter sp. TaxID=2906452 RepID=UPI002AB8FED8|nr:hypothetical protein [Allopontixanthobacter sp.]MDZ4306801.1 hypothetical protein [Allopontixanthobacter sp.]
MRILAFLILAASTACAPAATETAEPTESVSMATDDLITEPAALLGEYRVAGVDGKDINLPHGISASISAEEIAVLSQCVRFKWAYTLAGGGFAASRVPTVSCQRGLFPEEEAISRAFDRAVQVRGTPANGIEFSGEGHSVTLFSQ